MTNSQKYPHRCIAQIPGIAFVIDKYPYSTPCNTRPHLNRLFIFYVAVKGLLFIYCSGVSAVHVSKTSHLWKLWPSRGIAGRPLIAGFLV